VATQITGAGGRSRIVSAVMDQHGVIYAASADRNIYATLVCVCVCRLVSFLSLCVVCHISAILLPRLFVVYVGPCSVREREKERERERERERASCAESCLIFTIHLFFFFSSLCVCVCVCVCVLDVIYLFVYFLAGKRMPFE